MARSRVTEATVRSIVEDYSETTELHRKFTALIQELGEIDEQLESGSMIDITTGTNFSEPSAAERMAMIYAVDAVHSFLMSGGAGCKVLFQLSHDLQQLRFGLASGALTAVKPRAGRKRDSFKVSGLKGGLAGIARLRMDSGDSRNDAAAWVARNIPDQLASRLSSKPIGASTAKEWMDQYDCGAKVLDVFSSEEKQKEFESCFAVPAAADEGEDEASLNQRRMEFLRECMPENRRGNSIYGLFGFMHTYVSHLDGHQPNFKDLFVDLNELATGLNPADSAAAEF
jgi:hypothetical protein